HADSERGRRARRLALHCHPGPRYPPLEESAARRDRDRGGGGCLRQPGGTPGRRGGYAVDSRPGGHGTGAGGQRRAAGLTVSAVQDQALTGTTNRASVPPPARLSSCTLMPWLSAMRLTIASPRPVPLVERARSPRMKGVNRSSPSLWSMPGPRSSTLTTTQG